MCVIAGQGGPIVPLLTRVLRLAQLLRRLVLLEAKGLGGQRCPDYARPYLVKRRISRARHIIGERRKSAVIGSSQALKRDVFRSFKNALSDFFRRLYARIDRINYPNENALLIFGIFSNHFQYSWSVAFARQLYVKICCLQLEQAAAGVRHSLFPRCGLRPDPLPGTCAPQFAFALRQKTAPAPSY